MPFITRAAGAILFCALLSSPALAETFSLTAVGFNGHDGIPGLELGGSAPDGSRGFSGTRGGDGMNGQSGGDATAPSPGGAGGTIFFHLEKNPADATKLIYRAKVNGQEKNGELALKDLTVYLLANGGSGGNGARGGSGQDAGKGGEGGDADQFHFISGDGGRGGDGGNAGNSTSGANGGNGGTIVLQLRRGQEALAELVWPTVGGGDGGRVPTGFARGGRAGSGGQAGNNCYFHPTDGYKCVSRGSSGMSGLDGHPSYSQPQPGASGQNGHFTIEMVD